MKICLFGVTGLLGSEFKKLFVAQNLDFITPSSRAVSLLDHAQTLQYLEKEKPSLIVNCAAYTAVDKAENDPEACFALNTEAIKTLVESKIPLINFSTEYVFDAPTGVEVPEDYPRDPQSVYGKSKAKAEEILEASSIDWWNIRTSWLFGPGGNNFVETVLQLSEKYDELKIIDDPFGRPTYAPDLAAFVVENFILPQIPGSTKALENRSRGQVPLLGHYHLQNTGEPVSWAGFAEYFLTHKQIPGSNLGLASRSRDQLLKKSVKIKKITTAEYGAPAVRPKNSVLKNTKLKRSLRDWKDSVKTYLET